MNEHWTPPVQNQIKVNVDGAIFASEGRYGIGCVARDYNGQVLNAFYKDFVGCVQPEITEVIGIKEALSWIASSPWSDVIIESDSLVSVQAILSHCFLPSQFGFIVSDCKSMLAQLSSTSIVCIKRSANKAAHCLARASCFSVGLHTQEDFFVF